MSYNNRPFGQVDRNFRVDADSWSDEAFRGEYDANDNLIYKAVAVPGASEADEVWQIAKLSYDANDNLLRVDWPCNQYGRPSTEYNFSWTDRATYTYS